MQHQASQSARDYAKTLRTGMTDAEQRLWLRLRAQQLGVKFRRQHPLGSYILDFACLAPKLAIEVDGSQHLEQVAYDQQRSAWLVAQGFHVLRFWANEVLSETDAVVSRVLDALGQIADAPAPTPTLPQRGRALTEKTS